MNKCSLFDMTFSEIIEDIFGVSFDRLWELALADREKRCVVICPNCGARMDKEGEHETN